MKLLAQKYFQNKKQSDIFCRFAFYICGISKKSKQSKNMTKELENLISLLKSPIKENRDLGIILAQNYKEEFKAHFGCGVELAIFLEMNLEWNYEIPIHKIKRIKIERNILTSIPADIFLLENLTWLGIYSDSFSIFPIEILQLPNLKTLGFCNNAIKVLPSKIRKLQGLQNLIIGGGSRLQRLPKTIGDLKQLRCLNLGYNQLKSLPKEIGDLQKLTTLVLDNNQLKSLPKEIGDLQKLTTLFLGNNQFKSLPKEIWNLQGLTQLGLNDSQLKELPIEIGNLQCLRYLDLRNNQLKSLPKELAQIKTLENILIERNPKNIIIPDELRHIVDVGRGLI